MCVVPCPSSQQGRPLGYGYGGRDSVLVGILALVPAQEHESHAHELEAFRVDVTETDLIGGKGIHVLHQFDSLVLQVFQQLVH